MLLNAAEGLGRYGLAADRHAVVQPLTKGRQSDEGAAGCDTAEALAQRVLVRVFRVVLKLQSARAHHGGTADIEQTRDDVRNAADAGVDGGDAAGEILAADLRQDRIGRDG